MDDILPKQRKKRSNRAIRANKRRKSGKYAGDILVTIAVLVILLVLILLGGNSAQKGGPQAHGAGTVQTTAVQFSIPANNGTRNSSTLNITFKVINDQNNGNHGYWALGNYTKHIYATSVGNGTYLATITLNGSWRTVKGAKSPNAGVPEPSNGTGTFHSVYYALVPGRLNTSNMLLGFIGTFNFNGTVGNILNQTPPRDQLNWAAIYFSTSYEYINLLSENTSFVYKNQTLIQDYNYSKNNGAPVSYGDIIT